MPHRSTSAAPFTVLIVCTGNVCRSPLAERLGRTRLAELIGGAAEDVRIVSAGTRAVLGSAMDPASARVLRDLGGTPDGFAARQLTADLVTSADMTLTMTRDHRRSVLALGPRTLSRTFTLREAAGLLGLVPELPEADTSAARARGLVQQMAAARALRRSEFDDDIADPVGGSGELHARTGQAIAGALDIVLRRLADALTPHLAAGVDPLAPQC